MISISCQALFLYFLKKFLTCFQIAFLNLLNQVYHDLNFLSSTFSIFFKKVFDLLDKHHDNNIGYAFDQFRFEFLPLYSQFLRF